MTMFAPVELKWRDEVAKIPPGKILGAIACVEEHVTLSELATEAQTGRLRMVRVARAFGSVLRYAGLQVTDDEVYTELYGGNPEEAKQRIFDSIMLLMTLMVPPGAVAQGNASAPAAVAGGGVAKQSRNSIKRSLAAAGSTGRNSGQPIP